MKTPNTILSNRGFVNGCGEFVETAHYGGVGDPSIDQDAYWSAFRPPSRPWW